MARGLTEFTVQQATNFDAYGEWNYEMVATGGAPASTNYGAITGGSATYISAQNPAKKVVIYTTAATGSGTGSVAVDDADILYIQINGETSLQKTIAIDNGDLPFTISGLAITSLQIGNSDDDAHESVCVLSFH